MGPKQAGEADTALQRRASRRAGSCSAIRRRGPCGRWRACRGRRWIETGSGAGGRAGHARETGFVAGVSDANTRCGFAAIVGAPNAGKSTLVNALVGSKVSIVSPKVQTTRMRVIGIAMTDLPDGGRAQVVLVDTPGIFRIARRRLERAMVAAAWQGAEDADVVALVVDAERGVGQETAAIIERLKESRAPRFLIL